MSNDSSALPDGAPQMPGDEPGDGPHGEQATVAPVSAGPPPGTDVLVVGIGASAGGLAAFEAFFSAMPADTEPGMAFVLVQHMAPDHESLLAELIRRRTRMQVLQVEHGMLVQTNCAYIIPPGRDMALLNGALQLLEPAAPRGHRLPIDFFFDSLARDQRERAIGIVLSGTGSDGSVGLRAIKAEGGMVIVQSPQTCEFDGMPRSALATGLVDFELAPDAMPARLLAWQARAASASRTADTADSTALAGSVSSAEWESALKSIFVLLRAHTGHDFSRYKPGTIVRRIERRMALQQIDGTQAYLRYLQQTPTELGALFSDMLIGVTSFFRDPAAFQMLEKTVIPDLFASKAPGEGLRVWCTGCSTGEEAYSLAMLLQECQQALKTPTPVQMFATDIDPPAIATARAGLYPASAVAGVSAQRLARFFTAQAEGSAYLVNKNLRDMLVFSDHDVSRDPPFSRLDLLSCRNVLIYMGADLQDGLLPLFHYALKDGGVLFLGNSEGVGNHGAQFATVDAKFKLYRRLAPAPGARRLAAARLTFRSALPPVTGLVPPTPGASTGAKPSLRVITEQALLRQWAPVAALVNAQGDILYLHGRTGLYLEPAPGEAGVSNILKMARDGLRHELGAALGRAAATKQDARADGLRVKTNGHRTLVNLRVSPLPAEGGAQGAQTAHEARALFLVVLEQAAVADAEAPTHAAATTVATTAATAAAAALAAAGETSTHPAADGADAASLQSLAALQRELRANEQQLLAANNALEGGNQELMSSNEEMQSINEELQSSNEELETSKEELQSVNEELTTVNTELRTKVVDLSRANNDMNNLLAGTGIATVFVDLRLRILRFTPGASAIINLIPSDIGRPVGHLASNLPGYDGLAADTQSVLDTLQPKAQDVRTAAGTWYRLRVQPYRTLDNVIEGAVITFVDIDETVRTRDELRQANDLLRLAVVVRDAHDAITVQDLQGRILAWNPGAVRLYGWSEAEALQLNVRQRIPPDRLEQALTRVHQLSQAEVLEPYRTQRLTKGGALVAVSMVSTALVNEHGKMYAIATTERAMPCPHDAPTPGAAA